MTKENFYSAFANIPLDRRGDVALETTKGKLSYLEVYEKLHSDMVDFQVLEILSWLRPKQNL